MNYYKKNLVENISKFNFSFINFEENNNVFKIILNRPDKKNALHPQMINEIAFVMHYAHFKNSIWVILFEAKGSVFCAGADLKAMSGEIENNDSTIPIPDKEILIGDLFNAIHKPTIAVVNRDVYAGGLLIVSGCLFVVANKDVRFTLSEVKRGLFPMQVMASLLKVMPAKKVLRWCIRGYSMDATMAKGCGLISHLTDKKNIHLTIQNLINEILENSPSAIKLGLNAYSQISNTTKDHKYMSEMLKKVQATNDAHEGIAAFKEKRKPLWNGN